MDNKKIPTGWMKTELGAFVSVQGGCAFKSEDFCNSGIPIVRISNIKKDGRIDLDGSIFCQYSSDLARYEVRRGDILIAMSGATTGKVGKYKSDRPAYLNQRVGRFKVTDKSNVENNFIHQITSADQFVNSVLIDAAGGAQPNISNQQIEAFEVLLPPLSEQQKIATILSSVDDVIEKTRAQIDKLKDLKTGMMQELLTKGIGHTEFKDSPVGRIPVSWNVTTIGDLGKVITGSTPKTNDPANYNGDIPFISPSDIGEAMYIETTKSSITEKGIREIRELPKGSVCVVCIGSTIGKTGITTKRCATNQQVNSVVCKGTDPEFVYYLLTHYSKVIKAEAGTQAVPLINKSSFNALLVQLPPYSEQIKIGNSISSVDHREARLRKKLNKMQSIKKALMQDLLTGKVRVNLTDKESAVF